MNSAPLTGPLTRRHVPQHRQGRRRRSVVNIRTEMKAKGAGADRVLRRRRQRQRRARRLLPPLLRHARRAGPAGRTAADSRRKPREQTTQAAGTRLHHQQGRPDPHQQPRGRRRDEDRSVPGRRGSAARRSAAPGEARRPRPAHRQRADPAHRQAGPGAARSEVRRFVADRAGRLGDGDRQPVRLRAHGDGRRHQRDRARVPGDRRPHQRDAADRRGDQPGQLRRSAAERPRRGDRHQHGDHHQLADRGEHRHRLRRADQHRPRAAAAAAPGQGHARPHRRAGGAVPRDALRGLRPQERGWARSSPA